jgi:ferredoxin-NADP reductase
VSIARKIRCTVESITDHGGRVYTVDLAPATTVPSFRPGQFLHLTVDDYDPSSFWPESRVFSIASPPQDRSRIRICYSVKGCYTTKMERQLKIAGRVWIKLPYGDFVIDESSEAVLLAGGTGISAFIAFLETLAAESPHQVHLIYGARTRELLLFREAILRKLHTVAGFHVLFFCEAGNGNLALPVAALSKTPECILGRISLEKAWAWLPEPAKRTFYLSGPPVMLTTLSAGLKSRGVPPEQIRTDAWE